MVLDWAGFVGLVDLKGCSQGWRFVKDGRLGGARRLMRERRGAKPGKGSYKKLAGVAGELVVYS
jgi:hypothetical protein